ncbi:MAG TPA: aldolase/citrate lyase family protein [Phycisphaeraceae bacterium]
MRGAQIRQRLRNGERVYGTHIAGLMNPVAARFALDLELDFAFFCTEHMPLDRTEVSLLCQLYAAHGISPIVRVPNPDPVMISMALDGGAEGIVVPYVETPEQVHAAAGAVRYRPLKGRLLQEVLAGRHELPVKTRCFLEGFNREQYLVIGVESLPAIERLEELVTAAEVDGVFLGPHDITTSMGIPTEYDNPRFIDTVEGVIRRCRALSVGIGLHLPLFHLGRSTLHRLLEAGMNWLINGADIVVMRDAMNAQLRALRRLAGDEVYNADQAADDDRFVQLCIG